MERCTVDHFYTTMSSWPATATLVATSTQPIMKKLAPSPIRADRLLHLPNSTAAVTVWYEVRQCSLGIYFCLSLLLVAWMILKHTVCHNYIKRLSVCISLYLSCIKLNRIVKALHACHEGVNKTEQLLLLLNRSWKWHQLCCFATSSSL
jgi:hypothetical protein